MGKPPLRDLFLQKDHVAADVAEALEEFKFCFLRDPDRLQQPVFGLGERQDQSPARIADARLSLATPGLYWAVGLTGWAWSANTRCFASSM